MTLVPDRCSGIVSDAKDAGMISFKMSIHQVTGRKGEQVVNNFKEHPAWSKGVVVRPDAVKIRAYIYQCRDLPAADSNGTSDPFVQVWDMSSD